MINFKGAYIYFPFALPSLCLSVSTVLSLRPLHLSVPICLCGCLSLCVVCPSVCPSVRLSDSLRLDDWLLAAADCLELFPDQLIVAAGEQLAEEGPGATEGPKRLLFDIIAKHYGGQEKSPLLAGRYSDVHAAIHGLLGERIQRFYTWWLVRNTVENWLFFRFFYFYLIFPPAIFFIHY